MMKTLLAAVIALSGSGVHAGIVDTVKLAMNNQPPKTPFARQTPPAALDYARPSSWAARPDRRDAADVAPRGVDVPDPASRRADVFFIHPTTYYGAGRWNAAVPDAAIDALTDDGPLRGQASAFNACCRVWAPRYRQMVLGGYTRWSADSERASDLAYRDVARAFDQFVREIRGRPFIIAGHSQGSRLARRLIAQRIDGTPLARRMVVAYLPGTWIPASWLASLRDIRPCESAAQIACVATWSSYAEGRDATTARIRFARTSRYRPEQVREPFVCTNPLSWTATGETVPARRSLGTWLYGDGERPAAIGPGVSMRCNDGAVYVSTPPGDQYPKLKLPFIDWHNVDYSLAWMNVRANAVARVDAWMAKGR